MKQFLALVLVLLVGCSKFDSNTVKIVYKNFGNEIETQQNLVFEFNQALAPKGMVGEWHDKAYFSLKPEVKGSFRWESPTKLVFSPAAGFNPDTDYQLSFSSAMVEGTDFRLEKQSIGFHTAYLDLAAVEVFWAADATNQPVLSAWLGFNYSINPTDLQHLLNIKTKDKKFDFQILSTSVSSVVRVAVLGAAKEALENEVLNITINKGLSTVSGSRKSEELSFKSIVPEKEKFQILAIEAQQIEGENAIRVTANQAIGTPQIEKEVSLGGMNFTVERTENGFIIKGNFSKSANVTIKKTLKGIFGGSLEADVMQSLVFDEPRPFVGFAEKGNYLSTRGFKNVALRITGIQKIRVQIYKIYANNIMHYLRASNQISNYYNYDDGGYSEQESDYYYSYLDYSQYGDLVHEQNIAVKSLKRSSGLYLLNLDFEHNRDYKGVYAIKVSNYDEQYTNDSRMVSLSDIGLMAKKSDDEITVFAHSIHSAQPLSGVELTLISSNNQEVYSLKTQPDGIARFSDLKAKTFGFEVKMIAARQGDEFTMMHFLQTKVGTEGFGLGGLVSNAANLQAFVYGERELYRPGETLNLRTIVRDQRWQPIADIPVKIRLLDPVGKEFTSRKGILTKEGSFTTAIAMPAAALTGQYTAEVLSANNIILGSKGIFVEEFMPDRIKVEGRSSKTKLKSGETAQFDIEVYNLFGPPAVGRKVEVSYSLISKPFSPKGFKDYNFNFVGYGSQAANDLSFQTLTTDEKGAVSSSFTFDARNTGLYNVAAFIVAFDETGRPVRRKITTQGVSQQVFLGMQNRPSYIRTRSSYPVAVVALDESENVLNSVEIEYKIIRYRWTSVLEQDDYGRYRYVSQRKEESVKSQRLTIGGASTTLPFLPETPGEYELRVARAGDESHYLSQFFYAYEWGSPAESASYQINKEGKIIIETDKPNYNVGEDALLRFKIPFDGRLIVTVEREKLQKHFVIDTKDADAIQKLKIDADMLPNAYITATLIRPIQDNSLPVTVAHGFLNIVVNEPSRRIDPKITTVENSRSGVEQQVTVQTGIAGAEVTIAVVDEGILQIKNTKTPDPYGFFYQTRALGVATYDIYSRVFNEYRPQASAFGSDFAELGKRLNPFQNRRVKPVSFWSGNLIADSRGTASFKFVLPEGFSGQVRVMAVASKGHSFGSAEKNMMVADPVVVSYGLPRFLAPGDQTIIPATLTNTTKNTLSGKAYISVEGPLEIVENTSASLSLSANAENRTNFSIRAKKQLGEGKVTVWFENGKEKFKQELEITVRPATTLTKYSGAGEATSAVELDMAKGLISSKAKLLISQMPVASLAPLLVELVQYPYGCLEQSISAAFPQLYVKELYQAIYPNSEKFASADYNVQEAINKIKTMQRYDGSLSYWPGGEYANLWATVYATHFLAEAQKAGYEVEQEFLNRLYNFLSQNARSRNAQEYFYEEDGKLQTRKYIPREAIYSLYVLAVAGKADRSAMNYYSQRKEQISPEGLYLLAAAYRLIGDQGSARRLQPNSLPKLRSATQSGGDFGSYVRDLALMLNTLMETDPKSAQIPSLIKELTDELSRRESYLYSTQEKAFTLLALGKAAKSRAQTAGKATITANGKTLAQFVSGSLILDKQIAGQKINIVPQGGSVFYYWELEGLPESGQMPIVDNNLTVRREFFTRNGQRISDFNFKQNDLVVVQLTIQSNGKNIDNVVITDILPAAFEIENPRLSESMEFDWIKDRYLYQNIDIRDDRINFFTMASPNPKNYYYTVRVVSRGEFVLGPVAADAMYNADYRSYHGGGTVRVE